MSRMAELISELRYHEDLHQWNFGKVGALREISLASEAGYHYYYMGKD
jgi:arginine-tRNA-protein transferase